MSATRLNGFNHLLSLVQAKNPAMDALISERIEFHHGEGGSKIYGPNTLL